MLGRSGLLALAAVSLIACGGNNGNGGTLGTASGAISQAVKDKIALCSAGSSTTLSASLTAKIGKTLQEGGSVTATAGDELRGLFLARPGITEANAVALYDRYVECLQGSTGE